ncbi:MAG: hypothetical protein MUF34_08705, partial [Polyangiaceae bacterium]|nr:hypothetical protein [Polyangiaceae bacterium]
AAQPDPLSSLLVLFDTSASRALGFEAQIDALRALLADVARTEGTNASVAVFGFDQSVESVYEGPADGFGEAQAASLRRRGALGASDLEAALVAAGERARERGLKRVLVVSDGVTTAGDAVGDKVGAAASALKDAGVERLDALVVGGIRDESMLARIVRSGLVRDGAVIESDAETADISRRLRAATRPVEVRVEGASWHYPRSLAGVQSGDDVLVYAELPADQPLKVSVGGELQRLAEPKQVERALLQRAWARAKISSLVDEQKREGAQESGVKQIIDLSIKHRVVSPYTALLVLETEQDYARFGLSRRTLADILTPQNGRIEVLDRSPGAEKPEASPRPARPLPKPAMHDDAPALQAPKADESAATAANQGAMPARMMAPPRMAADKAESGPEGGVVGGVSRGAARPREAELDRSDPYAAVEKKAESESPAHDRNDAGGLSLATPTSPRAVTQAAPPARRIDPETQNENGRPKFSNPYAGKFREVMAMLAGRRFEQALEFARAWCKQSPGDVMALVALGTAYEAAGEMDSAARAYGSLIDLYPARADLRRFAGARLEHVAESKGMALAVDTFRKAVEQRPDHPSSHRLLAFALAKRGAYSEALDAVLVGSRRRYPEGRFEGVKRILREDAGLLGAALVRAEPERQAETEAKLRAAGASLERGPSLRFVLNWETDANDVDFHIYDAEGGHAFFLQPQLPAGGELYADVTTGYGPECFTVRKSRGARSSLYTLQAHYFSRGPMGYGMGKLEIVEHDGKGGLAFEERPFVIMVDDAFVNLGTVSRSPLGGAARTASAK